MRPGLISPGELPDQRRRLGSTPRATTIFCPWPEGFRGPCYERGSQWLDSTHGCQFIPTPTELRRRPSEGGLRVFDSLRGCQFAVEAHRDVQPLGKWQAAGANPAIGTKLALQALKAERRIRNPEVDRAIRSWGTSHGSLTQRDRDPPFKRSDPGAIPARPTNSPVTHRQRCARLVSGRGEVQVLSRAPIMESEAGRVLHAVANRWVLSRRHGLRVVRSPPILEGEVRRCAPSPRKRVAPLRVCGSRPTAFRHFGLSSGRRPVSKTGQQGSIP